MALLNIAAVDFYRFDIPFVRPMKVGADVLHHRQGFILALTDKQGRTGFGEVAPLPGLDQTSLEQCRNDLSACKDRLLNLSLHPDHFNIQSRWLGMASLPTLAWSSHTLFGIESALLGLYLQNPAATALPDPLKVPVNGLFIPDSSDQETDRQIQTLKQSGVRTIKVKIGRLPAQEEIRWILRLNDAIGKNLTLRLDGNNNLSADTYQCYYAELKHLNVEYAEDPLQSGQTLPVESALWPQAFDDSLRLYLDPVHPDPAKLPLEVRIVILKPGFLAGLHGMAGFLAEARKRNVKTVLSSAYNTGVTLATLSAMNALTHPEYRHSPRTGHAALPDRGCSHRVAYDFRWRVDVSPQVSVGRNAPQLQRSDQGRPMKQPFILKTSIRLDRLFHEHRKNVALVTSGASRTFEEVEEKLHGVITNLTNAGVRKGHLVALHQPNSELHLYLSLASWMMNFLYVPLDYKAPFSSLAADAGIDILVTKDKAQADARCTVIPSDQILNDLSPARSETKMAGHTFSPGSKRDLYLRLDRQAPRHCPHRGQLYFQCTGNQ